MNYLCTSGVAALLFMATSYQTNQARFTSQLQAETKHNRTLFVIIPDGQQDSISKPVFRKPLQRGDTLNTIAPLKWGAHLGATYATNFNQFGFMGGLALSHQPRRWGWQAEVNYVRSMDSDHNSYIRYNPVFMDNDFYTMVEDYTINNLEIAALAIYSKNKSSRIGVGLLGGLSARLGIGGNGERRNAAYYADGSTYSRSDYFLLYFPGKYKQVRLNGSLGITVGSNRISLGTRLDVEAPIFNRINPQIRAYTMIKFGR